MKRPVLLLCILLGSTAAIGWSFLHGNAGGDMTEAAQAFLDTLSDQQREQALLEYDTPQRVDWHFIPKSERKGLQIKEMDEAQRDAALALLKTSLSNVGYRKATDIMALEGLLHALEQGSGPVRDPQRYYFTIFGEPKDSGRWGLSVEGHHLSLNFAVHDGAVSSSTPTFYGANPAEVKSEVEGVSIEKGTRVLADEEQLAFELLHALNDEQRKKAVISDEALQEIRAAGEPQPPTDEPQGLAVADMDREHVQLLKKLVQSYARNLPHDVAQRRIQQIADAGIERIHLAWAGADRPGVGHYYRIQGPTFLIEFVNTQPDAAGNPANHIHCVWRDMQGDFAIPIQ